MVIGLAMAAHAAVAGQRDPQFFSTIMWGLGGLPDPYPRAETDSEQEWLAASAAAERGALRGSELTWFYKERARRGLVAAR